MRVASATMAIVRAMDVIIVLITAMPVINSLRRQQHTRLRASTVSSAISSVSRLSGFRPYMTPKTRLCVVVYTQSATMLAHNIMDSADRAQAFFAKKADVPKKRAAPAAADATTTAVNGHAKKKVRTRPVHTVYCSQCVNDDGGGGRRTVAAQACDGCRAELCINCVHAVIYETPSAASVVLRVCADCLDAKKTPDIWSADSNAESDSSCVVC